MRCNMKETPKYVVHPNFVGYVHQMVASCDIYFISGYNTYAQHGYRAFFSFFMDSISGSNPKFSSNKNRGTCESTGNNHSHLRIKTKPLLLNPSLMLSSN